MILYKYKDRAIIMAKILEILPGEGRAAEWKCSLLLEFTSSKNTTKEVLVDCWNSKDKTKAQMATRAGHLSPGDTIIALIGYKGGEYTCLAYIKDEGVLHFDCMGTMYYLVYGNVRVQQDKVYKVGIPLHYKEESKWHVAGFYGEDAEKAKKALDKAEKAVFIAKQKDFFVCQNGEEIIRYKGIRAVKVADQSVDTTIINIGPYKDSPVKLGDLIKKSPGRKKDVLYWMKYISECWNAKTDEEKVQKKAISTYLENVC